MQTSRHRKARQHMAACAYVCICLSQGCLNRLLKQVHQPEWHKRHCFILVASLRVDFFPTGQQWRALHIFAPTESWTGTGTRRQSRDCSICGNRCRRLEGQRYQGCVRDSVSALTTEASRIEQGNTLHSSETGVMGGGDDVLCRSRQARREKHVKTRVKTCSRRGTAPGPLFHR